MPDISFQCPSCSGSLNVPVEMANQLMECPSCKQTIEVPVRTRGDAPSASFTTVALGGESIFFQSGGIMVTNARFVVGAKTFAMRGVTSVEVVESEEAVQRQLGDVFMRNTLPQAIGGVGFILIIVGILCWLLYDFNFWVMIGAGIIGVLMIIVAASLSTEWKRVFKIVLKTAGGEVIAYQSFDRDHISRIIRALNDSIVSHG